MKTKECFFTVLFATISCLKILAQTDPPQASNVKITQMTLMVVPRTNENQDIRQMLDQSDAKRLAVAKIKEAFDKRGFKTIDFVARLNAAKTNGAFLSATPKDAKALIIQMSNTDLVVEADVIIGKPSANVNVVKIPLQCYDASSGFTLGGSVDGCQSRPNQTTDTSALVLNALSDLCLENFLNSVNTGFTAFREQGRPLKVNIVPSASSKWNLLSKVAGSTKNISTLITEWLEDHLVQSNYTVLGSSKLLLDLDDVRIPLLDARNKNYRPFIFGNDVVSFLDSKGIQADSEVKNGTIYITIN